MVGPKDREAPKGPVQNCWLKTEKSLRQCWHIEHARKFFKVEALELPHPRACIGLIYRIKDFSVDPFPSKPDAVVSINMKGIAVVTSTASILEFYQNNPFLRQYYYRLNDASHTEVWEEEQGFVVYLTSARGPGGFAESKPFASIEEAKQWSARFAPELECRVMVNK